MKFKRQMHFGDLMRGLRQIENGTGHRGGTNTGALTEDAELSPRSKDLYE